MLFLALTRSSSPCSSAIFACKRSPVSFFGAAGELGARRIDLVLYGKRLCVELVLPRREFAQRARRSRPLAGGRRVIDEQVGARPREVEREADDLIGDLAILGEDQEVARLVRDLLLSAERAVPIHGLIQHLDDFRRAHRRGSAPAPDPAVAGCAVAGAAGGEAAGGSDAGAAAVPRDAASAQAPHKRFKVRERAKSGTGASYRKSHGTRPAARARRARRVGGSNPLCQGARESPSESFSNSRHACASRGDRANQ